MELVLLSGCSGKRLWPLSNDIRSKQFLQLLGGNNDTMESMLQRVIRQIHTSGLTNNITIVTNENQLKIIISQVGNEIPIVTEPERRDTFAAIALTASFLKFTKGCPDNEVIVVMPCDSYTDEGYFEAIKNMVECVEKDIADIILMGITPTYPSEKYGYIIPNILDNNKNHYKTVNRFIEKPNTIEAQSLIDKKALWNGGVFAFRLGYIMNILQKYISSNTFEEIRNKYTNFPKISFDYEVVEKTQSVAVVPYTGLWKDLGTWNTLAEELKKQTIGNVIMGNHCQNTHVINELHIPIYIDGLKDIIVATCNEGILICDKKYTENIKNIIL